MANKPTPEQTELINRLRQGASICRDRQINLDFAIIADMAAAEIERLKGLLKQEEALPVGQDIRGFLAANLYCWHRLSGTESDELVALFGNQATRIAELARIAELEALCLNALYHHQGGSSPVGQPIRKALGIGEYDRLTEAQLKIIQSVRVVPESSTATALVSTERCRHTWIYSQNDDINKCPKCGSTERV